MYTSLTDPVAGASPALWRVLWLLLYLYSSSCRLPRRWEVRTPSTKLMASMRLLLPAPHTHARTRIGHLQLQLGWPDFRQLLRSDVQSCKSDMNARSVMWLRCIHGSAGCYALSGHCIPSTALPCTCPVRSPMFSGSCMLHAVRGAAPHLIH